MSKILLVDDEPMIRYLCKFILNQMKVDVVETSSGSEALLEIQTNGPFDAIFIDYRMPGIDGIQTIKEIRKLYPTAKIVFMSAAVETNGEAQKAGADEFLSKPIIKTALIELTNKLIN
jgi:CheY-like chemotaxis protein